MKRNKFLRIATILMVACLATLCLLPSTLARYTSIVPATAGTPVRAGRFRVYARPYTPASAVFVDFTPVTTTSITPVNVPLNFGALLQPGTWGGEAHVQYVDGRIIAPGTGGSFALQFRNNSEVPVRFRLNNATAGTSDLAPLPAGGTLPNLEFAVGQGGPWIGGRAGLLAALAGAANATATVQPLGTSGRVYIYWRWPFNVSTDQNTADTALGRSAAQNRATPATVPGAQVTIQFIAEQLEA